MELPTKQDLVCTANHLACYRHFALRDVVADDAMPCEICDYVHECDLKAHYKQMWLFKLAGVDYMMRDMDQFMKNKATTGFALVSGKADSQP